MILDDRVAGLARAFVDGGSSGCSFQRAAALHIDTRRAIDLPSLKSVCNMRTRCMQSPLTLNVTHAITVDIHIMCGLQSRSGNLHQTLTFMAPAGFLRSGVAYFRSLSR
jgi:hypothetical protein